MRLPSLVVALLGLLLAACVSGAEKNREVTPSPQPTYAVAPRLRNSPTSLDIPTYDGTGQGMHPDVVDFQQRWRGYRYWMAMTPYPYDTAERENPSILVSQDGRFWTVPRGVTNPLVGTPPCDHNSDPELVHNPRTDELLLYYTEVLRPQFCGVGTNVNSVKLIRSSDGVTWSEPITVLTFDLDEYPVYVSPAVVLRNGRFEMWLASNDDTVVYTTSEDGQVWGPPREVAFPDVSWHLDVQYIPSRDEYWMLYATLPGSGGVLKFARSADGVEWQTCAEPVLEPGAGWDNDRIYRATFLYKPVPNALRVWYSARSDEGVWGIGYTEGGHPGLQGGAC